MPEQKKYTVSIEVNVDAVDESQAIVLARQLIQNGEASMFEVTESFI